jgi:hypothetical protein
VGLILGEHHLAVGAERHAGHSVCVPLEGEKHLARLGVPHLDRLVLTGGRDALAVRAERYAGHGSGVPNQLEHVLTHLGVLPCLAPLLDLQGIQDIYRVSNPDCYPLAVRGEVDPSDDPVQLPGDDWRRSKW